MEIAPVTSSAAVWRSPRQRLTLGSDEVHVWQAMLERPAVQIESFRDTLSADERTRAGRFHFQRDREYFVVTRGILRAILGVYLDRKPECLSFCYSRHGKPALSVEPGEGSIYFNVSHSHGVALFAITRGRKVGIDLECMRPDLEVVQLAERFFSRREKSILRALPAALRRYAFFLCWTRKEAYLKARGEGLSLPLDQFDMSLIPGEAAALLDTRPDSSEALRWSLKDLTFGLPGYAAAIAVEGGGWSVALWQWPSSVM